MNGNDNKAGGTTSEVRTIVVTNDSPRGPTAVSGNIASKNMQLLLTNIFPFVECKIIRGTDLLFKEPDQRSRYSY
jgi:hypothetical protein